MSFVMSSKEMMGGRRLGEIYVKGLEEIDHYIRDENLLIFKGDIYPHDVPLEELFNSIAKEGIGIVEQMKGEFFIVYYDDNSRKVYFANSRIGREILYYFYDLRTLIVSDDFWEIVNLMEPKESDINVESIKEFLIINEMLGGKTIIANLNIFPSASIGQFAVEDKSLNIRQYWDFAYSHKSDLGIDEAVERLDHLLNNAMRQIKEKNEPGTIYGLGLSGGRDSRLVAYYALKNGMNLRTFIVGEANPHKIFLSWDHARADELAKYFNVAHYRVKYNSESFDERSFYDVRYNPMGQSSPYLGGGKGLPEFDVLLTGFGAENFGTIMPTNVMELDEEGLLNYIREKFFLTYNLGPEGGLGSKIRTALMYSLATEGGLGSKIRTARDLYHGRWSKIKKYERYSIDGIIQSSEYTQVESKVLKFIKDNSDKSNCSIFQKFYHFNYNYKDKYVAFASIHGQKKSYALFWNPYVLEEILTWKPEFVTNRRLQNYLHIKKFRELFKIKTQIAEVAISHRDNRFQILRKILIHIEGDIRRGNMMGSFWTKKKEYKEWSRKILLRPNPIFTHIFDVERALKLPKRHPVIYENIVKIKQILDLIYDKAERDQFMGVINKKGNYRES